MVPLPIVLSWFSKVWLAQWSLQQPTHSHIESVYLYSDSFGQAHSFTFERDSKYSVINLTHVTSGLYLDQVFLGSCLLVQIIEEVRTNSKATRDFI